MIESTSVPEESQSAVDRQFKLGQVVFANHVIVKVWRDPYDEGAQIIARHGQLGVILGMEHPEYMVNFGDGEHTVLAEDINPYQGHVVYR